MTYVRKEVVGNHVLYLGNALEIMPTLDPVDLICTDAPYLVSTGGNTQAWKEGRLVDKDAKPATRSRADGYGGWMGKGYINDGEIVRCDITWADWLPNAFRILKDDRQAYFMTNGENEARARAAAEECANVYDKNGRLIKRDGFRFHTLLTWDKRAALPNRWYQNVTEFALFMRKGKAFTINDPSAKSLFSIYQRDESSHPTEKPVELMSTYISNSTKAGEIVLDPFMGSGTTGVAAARLGRQFVGVEIEERWFDVACERVSRALDQAHMFDEPLPMPPEVQSSMFEGDAA